MTSLITGCAGFLLAVLWMDLIFDVQVFAHRYAGDELPERVLKSLSDYYHRDDDLSADEPTDCSCDGSFAGRFGISSD